MHDKLLSSIYYLSQPSRDDTLIAKNAKRDDLLPAQGLIAKSATLRILRPAMVIPLATIIRGISTLWLDLLEIRCIDRPVVAR